MNTNEDSYLDLVKTIILKNIPNDKYNIFLFGSRTKDKHRFAADIDVGVEGKEPLNKDIIYKVQEEIEESIVPFNVDIIDFKDVGNEFKQEAMRNIKIWNQVSPTN